MGDFPVDHLHASTSDWPKLTTMRLVEMWGMPVAWFFAIVIALRCIWPSPPKEEKAPVVADVEDPSEGTALTAEGAAKKDYAAVDPSNPVMRVEGEARGDYSAPWTETFDLTFLIIWIALLAGTIVWTCLTAPALFTNKVFWLGNLIKISIMCGVSLVGGAMCRWFCKVDENGYILTSKASWFKVNYTRKFQHFAAYAVPLLVHMKGSADVPGSAILHLAWGDVVPLLGFLVLIKPIREMKVIGTPFMMMFNSLDRPEDRPDCLKWIIGGNILPGLFIIIGFHLLFATQFEPLQAQLVMIFVLVAGVGDGLAEPVGIYFGTHKYKTRSCTSADLYTRSLEGSACVFLTTFVWLIFYADCFPHESQFWLLMVVLPPVMALAEATSPHTMDTPILMILGGALIYLDLRFTTCYAGNHGGLRC